MRLSVKTVVGAIIGASALLGLASTADAHHWHGCSGCGPQPTRYVYHDEYTHKDVFHHHNEWRHYPVYVPRLTVYVNRVHPSVTVHNITTIHRKPYPVIVDHSKNETVIEATTYKYEHVTHVVQEPCGCCSR